MAEAAATKTAGRTPSALSVLRESRGGVSAEMKAWLKEQQDVRKRLRAALARGPRTVPEMASDAGLDPGRALWHLMAMRRYGEVAEAGEKDRYVLYALKKG
jgi:hypothetical protein